jgi:hypothetical protein
MVIGKALAETYKDTTEKPLPFPLARIVRQIERREAGQRMSTDAGK